MSESINGNCKHCGVSFDGELIYETFLKQGKNEKETKEICSHYAGFEEHGLKNRWGRQIRQYCMERDINIGYTCPDCGKDQ
jgi:hypothetical protein